MMKTYIMNAGFLIIGACIGALVSRRFYTKLVEEELASIRECFGPKQKAATTSGENARGNRVKLSPVDEVASGGASKPHPSNRSSLDNNPYEQAKRHYNIMSTKEEQDAEDALEAENEDDETPYDEDDGSTFDLSAVDRTQPYMIDEREFAEEFMHHDKSSLTYYRIGSVLVDEDKTVIENPEEIIGEDAVQALENKELVWARNEPLCLDYEIIVLRNNTVETAKYGVEPPRNLSPRERHTKKWKDDNEE